MIRLFAFIILAVIAGCTKKEPPKQKTEESAIEQRVEDVTGISTVKKGELMKKKLHEADSINKKRLQETLDGIE